MANLWDNLDEGQRNQLVKEYVGQQGNKTNENFSRAKEQLINNPNLVQRLAKESGMLDEDEDKMQDMEDEDGGDMIERNVAKAMEDPVGDMQATGVVSKMDTPPRKQGETLQDYIARLQMMADGEEEMVDD